MYSARGMSDPFRFPVGPSSSVASVGKDCQVEDRAGEKVIKGMGKGGELEKEKIFLKD